MHGILDTSMGWVSNGVTGSNAFAAYDAGFDVWLGNSRANPPRLHMGGCVLLTPHAALRAYQIPGETRVGLRERLAALRVAASHVLMASDTIAAKCIGLRPHHPPRGPTRDMW